MTGDGNHTYVVIHEDGSALLVDAGVGDRRHLDGLAATLDAHRAQLRDVLVTHGHPDHASGAPAIAREHPRARFRKYPWPQEDGRYSVSWQVIHDGDACGPAGALVALHTPGHSPDHLAFWHPSSGTAFTGDLVVQGSSVMIHASRGGDLGDYLKSLERLLALKPSRLLPAHGPEITDPASVLRGYIGHRLMREGQVVEALEAGVSDVPSIVESIYDDLAPALAGAAAENVRAHLEKLRRDGRALERDGRWMLSDYNR